MAYRHHKLFYGSSYDRGLDILLDMWPEIKKEYPDATLDLCYGWNLFLAAYQNNPERMAWRDKLDKQMASDGITHHGRVGKKELAEIRRQCGIWAYPTYFTEINCITALDAQADGLVPVTMNLAALSETVGSGIKIDGDIFYPEVRDRYLKELLTLMGDEKRWKEESDKARNFAKDFSWEKIAKKWESVFN